jgi:hypothetical protein
MREHQRNVAMRATVAQVAAGRTQLVASAACVWDRLLAPNRGWFWPVAIGSGQLDGGRSSVTLHREQRGHDSKNRDRHEGSVSRCQAEGTCSKKSRDGCAERPRESTCDTDCDEDYEGN